jgi:hypothetical protein
MIIIAANIYQIFMIYCTIPHTYTISFKLQTAYYGPNVCLLLKFACWNPNNNRKVLEGGGLWEMIRSWESP